MECEVGQTRFLLLGGILPRPLPPSPPSQKKSSGEGRYRVRISMDEQGKVARAEKLHRGK